MEQKSPEIGLTNMTLIFDKNMKEMQWKRYSLEKDSLQQMI